MKINTKRFGEIEVDKERVITFDRGPLGFENKKSWILMENGLLAWMQCLDDADLAFVVANPFDFYSDYQFELSDVDMSELNVSDSENISVLSIVSVPPKVENMTMNLLAPIVINYKEKSAKQVILNNNLYSVRHYVYSDLVDVQNKSKEAVSA